MNKAFYVLLFFICPFLSSCFLHKHTSRKGGKHAVVNTDTVSQVAVKADTVKPAPLAVDSVGMNRQLIEGLKPLWAKRLDYKTFSAKARIRYESPGGSKEFTANIRMRKDSVIWVNITLLGISAARVFVTKDSIFLVNYVQREVTRLPLTEAAQILPAPIGFSSLQNLIAGDPLRDGTITTVAVMPDAWKLSVEDSSYKQAITYSKSDSTMQVASVRTQDPKGPQAKIDYNKYEVTDNRKVSKERAVRIENGKDLYSIDMSFLNTEFDKELDYPFSIPKNYKEKKLD